jgi:hypothetical protein
VRLPGTDASDTQGRCTHSLQGHGVDLPLGDADEVTSIEDGAGVEQPLGLPLRGVVPLVVPRVQGAVLELDRVTVPRRQVGDDQVVVEALKPRDAGPWPGVAELVNFCDNGAESPNLLRVLLRETPRHGCSIDAQGFRQECLLRTRERP